MPEKTNSMCRLINIKNEEDELCFQWCMRCHQTAKRKNKTLWANLNYEGMELRLTYEAKSALENVNGICIFIYKFDYNGKIRLRQQGRL